MSLVNNVAELIAALKSPVSGDVIELAAGNFGTVSLNQIVLASPVVVRPAADAEVHFDRLIIQACEGIAFEGLDLGDQLPGVPNGGGWEAVIRIQLSKHVRVSKSRIHGSPDGDPSNDRSGFFLRSNQFVEITDNELFDLAQGGALVDCDDAVVSRNDIHDFRGDAIQFSSCVRLTIEANHIRDGYKQPADHADGVQGFTTGTTRPSTDIVIRYNVIMQGKGRGTQGIFLRDETEKLPYERVTIENNLVYQHDEYNGIAVGGAIDLVIRNNTAVSPRGDNFGLYLRVERVKGGTISGNIADVQIDKDNVDVVWTENIFFRVSPHKERLLPELDLRADATVAGLVTVGIGYQPDDVVGPEPEEPGPDPDPEPETPTEPEVPEEGDPVVAYLEKALAEASETRRAAARAEYAAKRAIEVYGEARD